MLADNLVLLRNLKGLTQEQELKPSHRTKIKASICEKCRKVVFDY